MSPVLQIPNVLWPEQLQSFSARNIGEHITVVSDGCTIVEFRPLRYLEYHPIHKGNDIVISLGVSDDVVHHIVAAPKELIQHMENSGMVYSLEIIDREGISTFIKLSRTT